MTCYLIRSLGAAVGGALLAAPLAAQQRAAVPGRGAASAAIAERPGSAARLDAAFAVAFGNPSPHRLSVAGQELTYRPERLVRVGEAWALVSRGDNLNDCLACAGAVAIHYLRETDGRFSRLRGWLTAVEGSKLGRATDRLAVSRALSAFPVLSSEVSGSGQGYLCGGVRLIELRPQGPVDCGYIPTLYDSMGADPAARRHSIEGRIANIVKGRSFEVVYAGTFNGRRRYVFERGKPVVQGRGQVPQC